MSDAERLKQETELANQDIARSEAALVASKRIDSSKDSHTLLRDKLKDLVSVIESSNDPKEICRLQAQVIDSLELVSDSISTEIEYFKYQCAGVVGALITITGFIYTHNAIRLDSNLILSVTVFSLFCLLISLGISMRLYRRCFIQKQSQQMRIAYAKCGHWDALRVLWIVTQMPYLTDHLFNLETTIKYENWVRRLLLAGVLLGFAAWLASFQMPPRPQPA